MRSVPDEGMTKAITWQNRPRETMYPVVFLDALRFNICDDSGADSGQCIWRWTTGRLLARRARLWIKQTEGARRIFHCTGIPIVEFF